MANTLYLVEQYDLSVNDFRQIYATFKHDGIYLQHLGKALCQMNELDSGITILNKANQHISNNIVSYTLGQAYANAGEFEKAEKFYLKAISMVPAGFYSKYLLVKLYTNSKQEQRAKAIAEEIIHKNVKIPSRAIEQIKKEMEDILKSSRTRTSTSY